MNHPTLAIVTATIDLERAWKSLASWLYFAEHPLNMYIVEQGNGRREWERKVMAVNTDFNARHYIERRGERHIQGVVTPFASGVVKALHEGAEIIACLHDDVEFLDVPESRGWDTRVRRLFGERADVGLAGYGGALGLGEEHIYQPGVPYNPMQLVRKQFGSNMRDAEAHGERWTHAREIAVLDGFSQIGRAAFWRGQLAPTAQEDGFRPVTRYATLFHELEAHGLVHHAYDAALGAYAKALGWKVWFLPEPVHHHGGLTAVADPRYHEWANTETEHAREVAQAVGSGDQFFWERSHRAVYDLFKKAGVLPIRVNP